MQAKQKGGPERARPFLFDCATEVENYVKLSEALAPMDRDWRIQESDWLPNSVEASVCWAPGAGPLLERDRFSDGVLIKDDARSLPVGLSQGRPDRQPVELSVRVKGENRLIC